MWLKQIVPHEIINNGRHSGSDGVECTPHVLRLRPDCSSPGFRSDLWPFAACRLSQPVSCHISSCPICHEKAKTNRFITLNSMETRLSERRHSVCKGRLLACGWRWNEAQGMFKMQRIHFTTIDYVRFQYFLCTSENICSKGSPVSGDHSQH